MDKFDKDIAWSRFIRDFWVIARVVLLILACFAAVGAGMRIYNFAKGPTNDCQNSPAGSGRDHLRRS